MTTKECIEKIQKLTPENQRFVIRAIERMVEESEKQAQNTPEK